MANVTIFIADVFELTKVGTFAKSLVARVNALYGDCMQFANRNLKPPHTFSVSIPTAKPTPTKLDYIVYLLPIDFDSIAGSPTRINILADHWGFTAITGDDKPEMS